MWRVARIPKNAGIVTPRPRQTRSRAAPPMSPSVESSIFRADDERDFDVAGLDGLNGVSEGVTAGGAGVDDLGCWLLEETRGVCDGGPRRPFVRDVQRPVPDRVNISGRVDAVIDALDEIKVRPFEEVVERPLVLLAEVDDARADDVCVGHRFTSRGAENLKELIGRSPSSNSSQNRATTSVPTDSSSRSVSVSRP